MTSLLKTTTLALTALFALAGTSQAAVITLDGLGNPITSVYHSESQTNTGANTFATFDDVALVWTWDVSVTQTGTSGQMDITGNIQSPNAGGHHRGFSLTLSDGLEFASAAIIDAAEFTGFITPFVTAVGNTLTFVAPNFGAPNIELNASIAFTTNTTVPAPGAALLLGFGLMGITVARRKTA